VARKIVLTLLVLTVLAMTAFGAAAWYYSTLLTAEGEPWASLDKQVLAVDDDEMVLRLDRDTALPGRHAVRWDEGLVQLGEQRSLDEDAGTVTYAISEVVRGQPTAPLQVAWYAWYFDGTPADLGLEHEDVAIDSAAGALPSWYLPGTSNTWVIAVHGRDGDREEALRALPTLVDAGLPVLVIRYRNDTDLPTADGLHRLGDVEWQEVEAAMRWAQDRGAERFVLYGWSLGGAIVMQALDRAEGSDLVDGVVLDGPVLDWRATLDLQATDRGLPTALADVAGRVTELRLGLDLDDFDWVARAGDVDVKILAFHGPDDTYVAWEPTRDLAAARPDLVVFEQVDEAGHTRSWNADPTRYTTAVSGFLREVVSDTTAVMGDSRP
jgi:uncharacterized protein